MTRLGDSVSVAAAFVWLGMVLAISFLEAPLKFGAPGITLPARPGHRTARVPGPERAARLPSPPHCWSDPGSGGSPAACLTLAAALAAVLLVQVVGPRPGLDRRAQAIIAGADRTPSRGHVAYIVLEVVKVALLLAAGLVAVAAAVR
jgi:hypothetical protein